MSLLYLTPLKSSFNPLSIAGVRVWLDFSDSSKITLSGSEITQIVSKDSNAYVFSQGTSANRPTLQTNVQNGLSVSRYDHSNDFLSGAPGADLTELSIFIVLKVTTGQMRQFDAIIGSNTQTTGQMTIEIGAVSSANSGQFDIYDANVGSKMPTGAASVTSNTFYRACITYTATTPAGVFYLNNSSLGTTNQASMRLETSNMNIGDDNAAGFFAFGGDIGEIIIYDSVLSTTNQTVVDNYLKTKWGL